MTILLLAFISLSAQTVIYQVSELTVGKKDKEGNVLPGKTSDTKNLVCKININAGLITINNEAETIYELTAPAISYTVRYDDDGDRHTTTQYWATDEEGINCRIILIEYTSLNITSVTAVYEDMYVTFYMQKV